MKRNIIKYASFARIVPFDTHTHAYTKGEKQLGKSFSFNWKLLSLAHRLALHTLCIYWPLKWRPAMRGLYRYFMTPCFRFMFWFNSRTPDDTRAHKMQNQPATKPKPKPRKERSKSLKSTSTNHKCCPVRYWTSDNCRLLSHAGLYTLIPCWFFRSIAQPYTVQCV